jgi:hypothetical protein
MEKTLIGDPGWKNSDPGSGMEKFGSGIRDKHRGFATLVQAWLGTWVLCNTGIVYLKYLYTVTGTYPSNIARHWLHGQCRRYQHCGMHMHNPSPVLEHPVPEWVSLFWYRYRTGSGIGTCFPSGTILTGWPTISALYSMLKIVSIKGCSLVRVKRSSESAKAQIVQHDVAQFSRVQPYSVVQCSPEGVALLRRCSVAQ